MQYAPDFLSVNKPANLPTELLAVNERLSLALESARQVAFDWHIPVDRLYFSGELINGLNGLRTAPSDTGKVWNSTELIPLIHPEDKQRFREHLRHALKGTGGQHDGFHRVELRLKDASRGWSWVDISGKIVLRDSSGRAVRMTGTFCDIHERKRAETKAGHPRGRSATSTNQILFHDSVMRYRQLLELSPEAILVYRGTKLELINRAATLLLGSDDASHLLGRNILDFVHSDHHARFRQRAWIPLKDAASAPFVEQVWKRLDGTTFHAEIAASHLAYGDGPAVQVVVRDISSRKHAEALQLGQNRILNMIATGVALTDILMEIAHFADSQSPRTICAILQLGSDGKTVRERIAPSLPASCLKQIAIIKPAMTNSLRDLEANMSEPIIVTDIASDPRWNEMRTSSLAHGLKACASWPLIGKTRKILGTLTFYFHESITPSINELRVAEICTSLASIAIESRVSEEKIRHLAHYDGLTSLPNRFLFNEYFDLALENAQRNASRFAVFFIDLDKFKEVNDTLGHAAGDAALREIASRLRNCLRHTDKIARMGGDEFCVLIEELNDACYAADIAQKLLDAASGPVWVEGQTRRLSASIGIAIYPENGGDIETLLKTADSAMYDAKKKGKNTYRFSGMEDARPTEKASLRRPAALLLQPKNAPAQANP
jgi:diguanylate cyclase (GGDEF)-like protein/PAS domain S-box-containing protein